MAASVRIEDEAFSDVRYDVLANACHLADADHARGKMARLWRQCTAQQSYVLSASIITSVLGENGAAGIVESGLGQAVDGGIRIRGTKGRIEWLGKLRKNAAKGGRAKAAKRQPRGNPDAFQEAANDVPPPCPPAPAPAPAPIPEEESEQHVSRSDRSTDLPPDALRLGLLLVTRVAERSPQTTIARSTQEQRERDSVRHADHIDRLHRLGRVGWTDIESVIEWCTADSFWAPNIQSGKKLREKFNTLVSQRDRGRNTTVARPGRIEPLRPDQYQQGSIEL